MNTYVDDTIFDTTLVAGAVKCLSSFTSDENCHSFLKKICLLLFTSPYIHLSNLSKSRDKGE